MDTNHEIPYLSSPAATTPLASPAPVQGQPDRINAEPRKSAGALAVFDCPKAGQRLGASGEPVRRQNRHRSA